MRKLGTIVILVGLGCGGKSAVLESGHYRASDGVVYEDSCNTGMTATFLNMETLDIQVSDTTVEVGELEPPVIAFGAVFASATLWCQ